MKDETDRTEPTDMLGRLGASRRQAIAVHLGMTVPLVLTMCGLLCVGLAMHLIVVDEAEHWGVLWFAFGVTFALLAILDAVAIFVERTMFVRLMAHAVRQQRAKDAHSPAATPAAATPAATPATATPATATPAAALATTPEPLDSTGEQGVE